MPQSLSLVIVDLVFSTKDRAAWIGPEMLPRRHAYLAEVARGLGCHAYRVGGVEDHVHPALSLPRTVTQGDLVKELKTASHHWLGKQDTRSVVSGQWSAPTARFMTAWGFNPR